MMIFPSSLKFTIIIPPKPQKRARSATKITKTGKAFTMEYKDPDQRLEERRMINLLLEHRPPEPLQGPLMFGMKAYLPIPASKSNKWKQAALDGLVRPTTKPDLDNLAKNIKDVLKGIFWIDDCQVIGYLPGFGKYYGAPARWELEIKLWQPDTLKSIVATTYPDVCFNCTGPVEPNNYSIRAYRVKKCCPICGNDYEHLQEPEMKNNNLTR
jgi:Holliday junction resolvase RusA-like endonuclease